MVLYSNAKIAMLQRTHAWVVYYYHSDQSINFWVTFKSLISGTKRKKCFFSVTQYVPNLVMSKVPPYHPESHEIFNAEVCASEINQHRTGTLPQRCNQLQKLATQGYNFKRVWPEIYSSCMECGRNKKNNCGAHGFAWG